MFDKWVKGDNVTLVRNPDYWQQGLPYLDAIMYKKIPDAPVRLLNVMSGDADIAFQPPLDQIPVVTKNPEFSAVCAPGNPQVFLTLNTGVPPTSDRLVRQALFHGLDRAALTKGVYGDYASEAKDMFPAWHKYYDPAYAGIPYDPEKAKELLAEAGFTESNPLSFELCLLAESEYQDLSVLIQAQLAEIGVQVELRPMESATLVAFRETDEWVADVGRYILPSTVSDDYMWKQFGATGPLNPTRYNQANGYQHPEVEEMLLKARMSPEQEARQLYRQLVDLIAEDAPRIRIAYKDNCQITGPDVRNLSVQGTDAFPMLHVWLDE
jgi:peptide/nickel transport system substrate-binding protein